MGRATLSIQWGAWSESDALPSSLHLSLDGLGDRVAMALREAFGACATSGFALAKFSWTAMMQSAEPPAKLLTSITPKPSSKKSGGAPAMLRQTCQSYLRRYGRVDLVLAIPRRRRSADGRPLLLSALVTPALGTGADPFPVTTVPTEWTVFSHAVASTRRGQLLTVLASSQSSANWPKLTEPVPAFGGRRTRLVSTKLLHPRHLAPRSRPHATETTPPIIMRVACAHVANARHRCRHVANCSHLAFRLLSLHSSRAWVRAPADHMAACARAVRMPPTNRLVVALTRSSWAGTKDTRDGAQGAVSPRMAKIEPST